MRSIPRTASGMTGFALLAVALGCGKGTTGTSTPTGSGPAPTASGGGAQVFAAQDCGKCHSTEAGVKKGKGPILAGIGSKPGRTADWIIAHVKNPATHKQTSSMPSFEGKISDTDLKSLAEYLLSLK